MKTSSNIPSNKNDFVIVTLITTIALIGSFMSDMYLPALPEITHYFSTDSQLIQLTISLYLFGFALSQLLYGALSDYYGRKKVLLFGMGVCLFGTIICILSTHVSYFLLGRLIQGLGAGAGITVGRAIGRDLFEGAKLAKIASYTSLFYSLGPAFAPAVGGYLQTWFNWTAIFWFVFIYIGLIILAVTKILRETNQNTCYAPTNLRLLAKSHLNVVRNMTFIQHFICSMSALSGLFAYYVTSPFLLQNVVNLTPVHYGWIAIFIGLISALSRFINGLLVESLGTVKLMMLGNANMLLGGVMMLIFALIQRPNLFMIVIPMSLYVFGAGFIFANAFAGALTPFKTNAGVASAVYGFLQMICTVVTTSIISMFDPGNQFVLAMSLTILGGLSTVIYLTPLPRSFTELIHPNENV